MRTVVDLTYQGDSLPNPTLVWDNGDVMWRFGDVDIRMSYDQMDRIIAVFNKWNASVPATEIHDLNEGSDE